MRMATPRERPTIEIADIKETRCERFPALTYLIAINRATELARLFNEHPIFNYKFPLHGIR